MSDHEQTDRLCRLPDEILLDIFSYTPARSVEALRQSSKTWKNKIHNWEDDIHSAILKRENERLLTRIKQFDFKDMPLLEAWGRFCQLKGIWVMYKDKLAQAFAARYLASQAANFSTISPRRLACGLEIRARDFIQLYLQTHRWDVLQNYQVSQLPAYALKQPNPKSPLPKLLQTIREDLNRVKNDPNVFGGVAVYGISAEATVRELRDRYYDNLDITTPGKFPMLRYIPGIGMNSITPSYTSCLNCGMCDRYRGHTLTRALGSPDLPLLSERQDIAYCTDSKTVKASLDDDLWYKNNSNRRSCKEVIGARNPLQKAYIVQNLYVH